jgi:hypothetical protein
MASLARIDPTPPDLHDELRRQLATTESRLLRVLDQLARAEGELLRLRAAAQVEARRGY